MTPRLLRHCYADLGGDEAATTLVAGSGRSGTTWVGEVIASAVGGRLVFEPFLHDRDRRLVLAGAPPRLNVRPFETDRHLYIRETGRPEFPQSGAIDHILRGRVRHPWVDRCGRPGLFTRRVIKDIRCSLFLAQVLRARPRLKAVYVVRDPVHVVGSQLSMIEKGWYFDWDPSFVLDQPELVEDHLAPFLSEVRSAGSPAARQAVKWCVENYVALRRLKTCENCVVVRYDRLTRDRAEWDRVAGLFGDRVWSDRRFRASVGRVSGTAARSPGEIAAGDHTAQGLTDRDAREVTDLVASFHLDGPACPP